MLKRMSAARTKLTTVHSSDLSRNAKAVFSAAADHEVIVTRRDGEALVLMSKQFADARERLLELAAQIITATTDDRGTLGERMSDRFPWMLALSREDRETCAHDLVRASRASFATGEAHLAVAELDAWRETATAVASGLDRVALDWLESPVPVERP